MRLLKKLQSAARRRANFFVGKNSGNSDEQNTTRTVKKRNKQPRYSF